MKKNLFFVLLLCSVLQGTSQTPAEFKSPTNRYRPKPLWFWNNTTVTRKGIDTQLKALKEQAGYGGVSILPFGAKFGPKYLSPEYFDLYEYTAGKAEALGMQLSLYDEYGFPSGSGGAIGGDDIPRFLNRYPSLAMKRLDKIEEEVDGGTVYHKPASAAGKLMAVVAMDTATKERIDLTDKITEGVIVWKVPEGRWKIMQFVCVNDGDPNMDYLSKDAARAYVTMTHEQYYKRFPQYFGTTITETFFDEPTLYRAKGRVWTPSFNDEYRARYGSSPALYYPALWYDIGPETEAARNALFTLRSDLYAEAYPLTISRWSAAHGTLATGHQDNEEVENPVGTSGDLMKCFRYLDIPGIDKIGTWAERPTERFYKIVSSAAYNWDHSLVMSETYGAMGNLPWDSLYSIAMDQFAKGINVLIPHAAWYDDDNVTFLPELSSRNPLYADGLYDFNTFLGRMHTILQNEDRFVAEIAVLYPIHTMQGDHRFDGPLDPYRGGVEIPYLDYVQLGQMLTDGLGRDFEWLHPEVLADRCTVGKRGTLDLSGTKQYNSFRTLIIPASKTISVSTLNQAAALYEAGGKVIFTSQLPTRSAEAGADDWVVTLMGELLPQAAQGVYRNRNKNGGEVLFIEHPDLQTLSLALQRTEPYDVEGIGYTPAMALAGGKANPGLKGGAVPLRYIHKERNGKSIFYFANLSDEPFDKEIALRGKKRFELWNPHTGETYPVAAHYDKKGKENITLLRLTLPRLKSLFLVEK